MDNDQRLEYLNRNSIKKYSGWKNYSPNVWTALHWNPKIDGLDLDKTNDRQSNNDGAKSRSNRPSTAPPAQFGLRFNSKNEIPQKVNYLMDTVQDLQFQIEHFQKNLSQQNVLIENLTDVVEKLSIQNQNRINKESINDDINNNNLKDNNDNMDKESDEECKENNDNKSKSKRSSPKKISKDIVSNQKKRNKRKKDIIKGKRKVIPTYFAVDPKALKNMKPKSEISKEKKGNRKVNQEKKKNKRAITPRVVKSNKIKRKQLN